jgi:hypothetical protein
LLHKEKSGNPVNDKVVAHLVDENRHEIGSASSPLPFPVLATKVFVIQNLDGMVHG